jgi:hypothetical protein
MRGEVRVREERRGEKGQCLLTTPSQTNETQAWKAAARTLPGVYPRPNGEVSLVSLVGLSQGLAGLDRQV